jgi:hypothetical protein
MAAKKLTMAKNVNLKREPEDNYKSSTEKGKGPSKKAAVAIAKRNEGFSKKKK